MENDKHETFLFKFIAAGKNVTSSSFRVVLIGFHLFLNIQGVNSFFILFKKIWKLKFF